jgi:hypothetical protein
VCIHTHVYGEVHISVAGMDVKSHLKFLF